MPGFPAGVERVTPQSRVPRGKIRRRYVLTFSVTGKGRFIGHLDRVEIFRRAVRRAGGRLALSEGMRPKPLLSLALPLAVGVEGLRELCEFELAGEPPQLFFEYLKAAVPAHIELLALDPYEAPRSLSARVVGAVYEVRVRVPPTGPDTDPATDDGRETDPMLAEAAGRFAETPALVVKERREGRVRNIDVKTYVDRVRVEPGEEGVHTLMFRAAVTPSGTARPERIVEAMSVLTGLELGITQITRTRIELA